MLVSGKPSTRTIAFNNAGVEQPTKPLDEVTEDEWDRLLDVNLRGVFLCMKHDSPGLFTAAEPLSQVEARSFTLIEARPLQDSAVLLRYSVDKR